MSLATIRNGLFATLTACGPFAATEISTCSFDPLQHTSLCAIVFLPGDSEILPQAIGRAPAREYHRRWQIAGTMYIKDTGDPKRLLSSVWLGVDSLYETIAKDDTLQSSACAAAITRISYDAEQFVEAAGAIWAPIRFTVLAEEF